MSEPAPATNTSVFVLCPMAIEHRAVSHAVRELYRSDVCVRQTGIGKAAVVAAVRHIAMNGRTAAAPSESGSQRTKDATARLVILAGACGGLREVGDVPRIGRVIDEHGHAWSTGDDGDGAVTLIGVDRVVSSPGDKQRLADSTGAAIVDMESHAFIAACEQAGLRWAIVRGVSDTPDETLPGEVLNWIDAAGNTRNGRAAWDLFRKPRLISHIVPVIRRSNRVLPQVGRRVVELIGQEGRGIRD